MKNRGDNHYCSSYNHFPARNSRVRLSNSLKPFSYGFQDTTHSWFSFLRSLTFSHCHFFLVFIYTYCFSEFMKSHGFQVYTSSPSSALHSRLTHTPCLHLDAQQVSQAYQFQNQPPDIYLLPPNLTFSLNSTSQ